MANTENYAIPKQLMEAREDLITLRDSALASGQMEWAVRLSHHIALLKDVAETLAGET